MTLTASTSRVQYNGDDDTVSFAIPYITWDEDDTEVILTDSSGVETVWVRGTQYTISLTSPPATSTLAVIVTPTDYTPATGETLTIISNLPNTQPTDLPVGGALPSTSVEQQLDQTVRQIQQSEEAIGRSLKYPLSDSPSVSAEIPNSTDRADTRLGFDATGEPIAVTSDITGVAASAFGASLVVAANASAARTTLELVIGTDVLANLSEDATPQLGGALDPNGQFIGRDKGGDIGSASPLVIDTDGDYFDVTGTTGFSAMTVATNRSFVLRFVSTVTITVGAGVTLNNAGSNYTTAAGDIIVCQSTAANTVTGWVIKADGTAVTAAPAVDVQTFIGSGTWTDPGGISRVLVLLWGGGGSGARNSSEGGGAGGGAFAMGNFDSADLSATETVTVGAGGAAKTTDGDGDPGGNTTFGALLTGYGGGGGAAAPGREGGGGGGLLAAGTTGGAGGGPLAGAGGSAANGGDANSGGGGGGDAGFDGGASADGGGGGGGGETGGDGGASHCGGGGGGGSDATTGGLGGTSVLGGDGGAAGAGATNATAGAQPGGGGGGSDTGDSGAGGDGQCIVISW